MTRPKIEIYDSTGMQLYWYKTESGTWIIINQGELIPVTRENCQFVCTFNTTNDIQTITNSVTYKEPTESKNND